MAGKKKPAPVGDAIHTPKAKYVTTAANPTGNRAERRLAAKLDKGKKK
ncbi:hypothetical protein [Streptomyces sp. NBC_01506]